MISDVDRSWDYLFLQLDKVEHEIAAGEIENNITNETLNAARVVAKYLQDAGIELPRVTLIGYIYFVWLLPTYAQNQVSISFAEPSPGKVLAYGYYAHEVLANPGNLNLKVHTTQSIEFDDIDEAGETLKSWIAELAAHRANLPASSFVPDVKW